jgi:ABC-type transport system involved in cytochrome c biogenesis ATPase subunit
MDNITIEDIREMTDEEKAALNAQLYRALGKKMLKKIAVGAGVVLATHIVLTKLESRWDNADNTDED